MPPLEHLGLPRLTVRKKGRRSGKVRHPALGQTASRDATATISKFKDISDLSRPTIYRMIDRGDLKSVTIGRRRLILLDSWSALIARQLAEQDEG